MKETLYTMSKTYIEAFNTLTSMEDMDDQTVTDTLDGLEGELQEKMLNVAKYQQGLEAEAVAIKNAIGNMQARMKSKQNQAMRLKAYLSDLMLKTGETKVSDPFVALSFRKSVSVVVDDQEALPTDCITQKVTYTPNKTAIKKAIQAGEQVTGAHLSENRNLQIK